MASPQQEALAFKVSVQASLDEKQVAWVEEMRVDRDFALESDTRREGTTTALRAAMCLALKNGRVRILHVSVGEGVGDRIKLWNYDEMTSACKNNAIAIRADIADAAHSTVVHDNGSTVQFVTSDEALAALREIKAGFPADNSLVVALDNIAKFYPEVCSQLHEETKREPLVPTVTWSIITGRKQVPRWRGKREQSQGLELST